MPCKTSVVTQGWNFGQNHYWLARPVAFQTLQAHANSNQPILWSIRKNDIICCPMPTALCVLCIWQLLMCNYKYAGWKLSETCFQTPKCPQKINSFCGPVHYKINQPKANLGSHGPLGRWIFSPHVTSQFSSPLLTSSLHYPNLSYVSQVLAKQYKLIANIPSIFSTKSTYPN